MSTQTNAVQADQSGQMSAGVKVALHDAQGVLNGLNLLGLGDDDERAQGLAALFRGPPQSVALIEAGATAASKWWAGGLSGAVVVVWGALRTFWSNLDGSAQEVLLWGASIATAAVVLAVGMILASDLRGRALAATATIEARARLAEAVLQKPSQTAAAAAAAVSAVHAFVLPHPLPFTITTLPSADETGWEAILMTIDGDSPARYLLWKGNRARWAGQDELTYMGY